MKKVLLPFILILTFTTAWAGPAELFQQAWDHTWRGEHQAAVETYRKFAAENQKDDLTPVALFNAASITLEEIGDLDAAKSDYLQLTSRFPGSKWAAESYLRLGEIAATQEMPRQAVEYYRKALEISEGDDYQMSRNWITTAMTGCQGNIAKVADPEFEVEVYRDLLEYIPPGYTAADAMYSLSAALKAVGKEREAAEQLAQLLYSYPLSRTAGTVMQTEREFIDSQLASFPWEDIEQATQMQGLARQFQFDAALEIARDLAARYPGRPLGENAEFSLIVLPLYQDNDFESGLEKMEAYQDKYPRGVRSYDASRQIELYEEVVQALDRLKFNPDDYGTHIAIGFQLLRNGYFAQAEEHFVAAIPDTTTDVQYMGLGYTYLRSGRTEEGIQAFERYLENNQDNGNIFNQVGYAYLGLGQVEKALECFEHYKDLEPDNPNSHDSYAECLMNLGRYDEAIVEYKAAIELNPGFTNPYFMLGQIYNQLEDRENALKYYQLYLENDPNGFQSDQARENVAALNE